MEVSILDLLLFLPKLLTDSGTLHTDDLTILRPGIASEHILARELHAIDVAVGAVL